VSSKQFFCKTIELNKFLFLRARIFLLLLAAHCLLLTVTAQKIAVLTPEKTGLSESFADRLKTSLAAKFKVLNSSLSETAFLSVNAERPFNMSAEEAKIAGAAIGCDFFLLVKSENLRRFSLEKKEYFESYAAVYAVSARTGRLVFWKLQSFNGYDSNAAEKLLFESTGELVKGISERLPAAAREELSEVRAKLEEVPDENSPDAKTFARLCRTGASARNIRPPPICTRLRRPSISRSISMKAAKSCAPKSFAGPVSGLTNRSPKPSAK